MRGPVTVAEYCTTSTIRSDTHTHTHTHTRCMTLWFVSGGSIVQHCTTCASGRMAPSLPSRHRTAQTTRQQRAEQQSHSTSVTSPYTNMREPRTARKATCPTPPQVMAHTLAALPQHAPHGRIPLVGTHTPTIPVSPKAACSSSSASAASRTATFVLPMHRLYPCACHVRTRWAVCGRRQDTDIRAALLRGFARPARATMSRCTYCCATRVVATTIPEKVIIPTPQVAKFTRREPGTAAATALPTPIPPAPTATIASPA